MLLSQGVAAGILLPDVVRRLISLGDGSWHHVRYLLILLFALCPATSSEAGLFVRVVTSQTKGPTLIVIGVDEAGGSSGIHTVRQLQWHAPERGTLVLVRSHAPFSSAVAEPGWKPLDSIESLTDRFPNATRIVLRESYEASAISAQAKGATVAGSGEEAESILSALSALSLGSGNQWQIRPSEQSKTVVVTTSSKNPRKEQRPAVRQLEQRVAVGALMNQLGMTSKVDVHRVFPTNRNKRLRVAVYDDKGSISSSGHGPAWIRSELAVDDNLLVELVGRLDIMAGGLQYADVLVMGGGYSSQQGEGLEEVGREAIREFVRNGGGYVGICAGAFFACQPNGSRKYLGLLPVDTKGNSGTVVTPLEWSDSPVGPAHTESAKFSGGPRLIPQDGTTSIHIWASYRENPSVGSKSLPLKDTPAVLSGKFGKGNVVVFGPHCERRPSNSAVVPAAIRWAAGSAWRG